MKTGNNYRVSQKFVPLNSCTITFDQNFIFTRNCQKMFIFLLSTCIQNFSNWHALFVFLSHSVAVAACSGTELVDLQMIHFELLNHLVRNSQFNPQTIFFLVQAAGKKDILGIHPKTIIIPASFHSKVLYCSTT